MKLHTDREMFSNAIQATSQMLGMAPEFVEKDYEREFGITISNSATLQLGMNYQAAGHWSPDFLTAVFTRLFHLN
ncbi:MAG: hypothetical protein V8T07_08470 [Muribaculaceae bacterium]